MQRELTPDERADALAASQHSAISHRQALDVGLTRTQIRQRRTSGRWRAACHGVYVLAGAPASWQQRAMVACLAGPDGTVASYLTAAALFGLAKAPLVPHVTVPRGSSGRFRRAVVHKATLDRGDVGVVDGMPCTRPARTLVDCAGIMGFDQLCEL